MLKKIRYQSGYKYQLHETYKLIVDIFQDVDHPFFRIHAGWLTIQRGYAWDGPSGPSIDTKSWMRASLVHDCLYQAIRLELLERKYKTVADELMYEICLQDGMWKWRAWYSWRAVVRAGAAVGLAKPRKVHCAPY